MKVAVLLLAVLGVVAADTKLWYSYPSPVIGPAATYTTGGHIFPATTYVRPHAVAPSAFQYHLPATQYSVPVVSAPGVVGPTLYQYPSPPIVGSAVIVGEDDDDDDNDRDDDDDDDDRVATFYGAFYHDDD
ncbi:uncharacterized protein [Panulirus ornatus]|uniref:uncharacterized protein n=1 Tax=Panulirus ornatus TaxID=150431 RepID=UPI003A8C0C77